MRFFTLSLLGVVLAASVATAQEPSRPVWPERRTNDDLRWVDDYYQRRQAEERQRKEQEEASRRQEEAAARYRDMNDTYRRQQDDRFPEHLGYALRGLFRLAAFVVGAIAFVIRMLCRGARAVVGGK